MKILFLDIPGYDGYKVSNNGVVASTKYSKWRLLKQHINSNGYWSVKANNKSLAVHRAVALAFVEGNSSSNNDVNHKDGNKLHNYHKNLEWCSRRDNIKHSLKTGLHALRETPIVAVGHDGLSVLRFSCQADVKAAGFSQPNVNKCLKGLRPRHKGYSWYYLEVTA